MQISFSHNPVAISFSAEIRFTEIDLNKTQKSRLSCFTPVSEIPAFIQC